MVVINQHFQHITDYELRYVSAIKSVEFCFVLQVRIGLFIGTGLTYFAGSGALFRFRRNKRFVIRCTSHKSIARAQG